MKTDRGRAQHSNVHVEELKYFIDRTAEECDWKQGERGSDTQQRDPGRVEPWSAAEPRHMGRTLPTELSGARTAVFLYCGISTFTAVKDQSTHSTHRSSRQVVAVQQCHMFSTLRRRHGDVKTDANHIL